MALDVPDISAQLGRLKNAFSFLLLLRAQYDVVDPASCQTLRPLALRNKVGGKRKRPRSCCRDFRSTPTKYRYVCCGSLRNRRALSRGRPDLRRLVGKPRDVVYEAPGRSHEPRCPQGTVFKLVPPATSASKARLLLAASLHRTNIWHHDQPPA